MEWRCGFSRWSEQHWEELESIVRAHYQVDGRPSTADLAVAALHSVRPLFVSMPTSALIDTHDDSLDNVDRKATLQSLAVMLLLDCENEFTTTESLLSKMESLIKANRSGGRKRGSESFSDTIATVPCRLIPE